MRVGAVRPVLGPTYPLELVADAHRAMTARSAPGRITMSIAGTD